VDGERKEGREGSVVSDSVVEGSERLWIRSGRERSKRGESTPSPKREPYLPVCAKEEAQDQSQIVSQRDLTRRCRA
jgi:hypothetical protein